MGGDCEYQCSQAVDLGDVAKVPFGSVGQPAVMSLC